MRIVLLCCLLLSIPATGWAQRSGSVGAAPSTGLPAAESRIQSTITSACSQRCGRILQATIANCGAERDPATCQSRASSANALCTKRCQ